MSKKLDTSMERLRNVALWQWGLLLIFAGVFANIAMGFQASPAEPLEITPQTKEGSWEAYPGPMTPGWDFYAIVPRLKDEAVQWIGDQPIFR